MDAVQLKLKQASAVLGVTSKELQNLVQLGVVRPRRRDDVFWFDTNLLVQAKIALYVKASLRPSIEYLAQMTKEVARVNLVTTSWDVLRLASSPGKGKPPVEIKVPLRELKKEVEENLPMAEAYKDLPRGTQAPRLEGRDGEHSAAGWPRHWRRVRARDREPSADLPEPKEETAGDKACRARPQERLEGRRGHISCDRRGRCFPRRSTAPGNQKRKTIAPLD